MRHARVAAQAKINLRLKVLARESSGYHAIETIFHRVDLADDVTLRVDVSERAIDCTGGDTGPPEKNLAYRAATAYAAASGWPTGFAIEIEKRIPIGGGMGGGSADAGAVLRALETLAPHPIGGPRLRDLAAALGADVPFMTTTDSMALAWGRGERMIGLPALPARDVVALIPSFGIATADAYRWWDEDSRPGPPEAWRKSVAQLADWDAIERLGENDFDGPVFARHPELGALSTHLGQAGATLAMLSGSGSTVIGVFPLGSRMSGAPLPPNIRFISTRTSATVPAVVVLD